MGPWLVAKKFDERDLEALHRSKVGFLQDDQHVEQGVVGLRPAAG